LVVRIVARSEKYGISLLELSFVGLGRAKRIVGNYVKPKTFPQF